MSWITYEYLKPLVKSLRGVQKNKDNLRAGQAYEFLYKRRKTMVKYIIARDDTGCLYEKKDVLERESA